MQGGLDRGPLGSVPHAGVERVLHEEIREGTLVDIGRGQVQHPRRAARGLLEHRVHLPPGRVIADGQPRDQQRALGVGQARVVADGRGHQHRVGDGDLLVADVHELDRERADLGDHALRAIDLDVVALAQRARVDHHQAAHRLHHQAR